MDRIDNRGGYIFENVQIIAGCTNRVKDSPHGWRPKLTSIAVHDIRNRFKKGVRGWKYFADKYGVSIAAVKAVRTARNWKTSTET